MQLLQKGIELIPLLVWRQRKESQLQAIKEKQQCYGKNTKTGWVAPKILTCILIYKSMIWSNQIHLFSKEEIDDIIRKMPPDKAPRHDGFSGVFLKKCWHIIKDDIYSLCFDFFNGTIDLQPINSYFITLVPMINNPSSVNDFRPISLINCVVKIITQLLGNRL
jgi:hypothetical protein